MKGEISGTSRAMPRYGVQVGQAYGLKSRRIWDRGTHLRGVTRAMAADQMAEQKLGAERVMYGDGVGGRSVTSQPAEVMRIFMTQRGEVTPTPQNVGVRGHVLKVMVVQIRKPLERLA